MLTLIFFGPKFCFLISETLKRVPSAWMLSAYFLTFGIFESPTKKDGILKGKEQNVGIQSVERIRLFLIAYPIVPRLQGGSNTQCGY